MQIIAQGNGCSIASDFGDTVLEGYCADDQGPGLMISFEIVEPRATLRSAFVQIVPVSGQTVDFWDFFWANRASGEPADQFALGWFSTLTPGDIVSVHLTADSVAENDEVFALRVFDSMMDAAWDEAPLFETRFTIRDDDRLATVGNDRLWRGDGDQRIAALSGNDTIDAGAGSDTLIGGAGDDLMIGNSGDDTADYAGITAIRASLARVAAQATGHGTDTLRGIENLAGGTAGDDLAGNGSANRLDGRGGNDTLRGAAGDDRLVGGLGADRLEGGGGNDRLVGGLGSDLLIGGAGADRFVFARAEGRDVIADFTDRVDRIVLTAADSISELRIVNRADGAVVSWDGGRVMLTDIAADQLTAADFIFV